MPRITKTAFVFNDAEGKKTAFAIGDEVPDELCEHWYVLHHTDEPKKGKAAAAKTEGAETDGK